MEALETLIVGGGNQGHIRAFTTEVSFSLSTGGSSQLTVRVNDKDLEMNNNGYWQIRQAISYDGREFEIAKISIDHKGEDMTMVTIDGRSAAIQQMKRDKGPVNYGRMSSTEWAAVQAENFGLGFFGEDSPEKEDIVRQSRENNDESTWDVLTRLASDLEYAVYEAGGILFFASEQYILDNQPEIDVAWPPEQGADYFPHSLRLSRSDDDPQGGDLTVTLTPRDNAKQLLPGFGLNLSGVSYFTKKFMITDVDWDEGSPSPVTVKAETPDPEEEEGGEE